MYGSDLHFSRILELDTRELHGPMDTTNDESWLSVTNSLVYGAVASLLTKSRMTKWSMIFEMP